MEPVEHRAKMKPVAGAPAGLETDGKGQVIPLAERTLEDRVAARREDVKDPVQEAQTPAPMPQQWSGEPLRPRNDDPAGQQGGTKKNGRDRLGP